mmetsp:Transcript_22248/g.27285  ORF Transcript_22248/g.27285 Transcript_22248/m.27285 type:complete len:127 (-) Transcript_22248:55-435(-)
MMTEENRELIFGYEAAATFIEKYYQPCRFRTSNCPDRCGHAANVFTFHLDILEVTHNPESKNAKYCTPLKEGDKQRIGEENLGKEFLQLAHTLVNGDTVKIVWKHEYVRKDGSSGPEYLVRELVKL